MDRDLIVGQVMHYCKRLLEHIFEAAELQTVATASLAIFDQIREVARVYPITGSYSYNLSGEPFISHPAGDGILS